jgi:uncharacterized protein (TIGR00369 family)
MTKAISMNIPDGYSFEPSTSAFPNHVGTVFQKQVKAADGTDEYWIALRVEQHHVNTWQLAHGGLMAVLAEMVSSAPGYVAGGPPVVVIDMSIQFMKAPKLGELIEARGIATRRTRSLVFTRAEAMVGGDLVFTATAVHKIVGA